MEDSLKGKFITLYLLLFILPPTLKSTIFVNSNSDSAQHELDSITTSDLHQLQLQKLEQLVKNLTEIVDRLESRILNPPTPSKETKLDLEKTRSAIDEPDKSDLRKPNNNRISVKEIETDGVAGKAASVTKYSPFWSERFQFVSAVKLDSDVTCTNVLPFRDSEGLTKYFAVGDERGRVYVFMRNGDVSVEFYTVTESPITSMLSYLSVNKNESLLVTGHNNGMILMHRVWEAYNGEDLSSLLMESIGSFEVPKNVEDDDISVSILEVHLIGRMRYVLSVDFNGKIRVYKENGTLYGMAVPTSRPLVFLKQRLLFLTERGAGSLDLRTMKVRESDCEGLNHSLARNYVFDASERSKAYGFTSDSDLIQVLLLGDVMNFKCRVRSKRKFEMDDPIAFQAIKGYLLVVNQNKVFVYNVSSQHYVRIGAPRLLFNADYDEIRSSFLNHQIFEEHSKAVIPLIASDHEKLIVLGLGNGYVGMYRSNLPIYKGESNTILWTSPVLFFIFFLFGAWHFFAKKKEVLTSWGPDDPFTSTSTTNGESSKSSDLLDMRGGGGGGGGMRGPARRYPSPTRYGPSVGPVGASFRPNPADHNSGRPAAVESNFRANSELKFRGAANMEPAGFPKRREMLLDQT